MSEFYPWTGKGIGVCILDTGCHPHIDFEQRIRVFGDLVQYRTQTYDDNGHGTHVAGILAGSGKASDGRYCGIAPGCHLIIFKVLDRFGAGKKENVLRALYWIIENKERYNIRIVNISVGTTYNNRRDHQILIEAVEKAWDAGLVVVAAAGNQGPNPGTITAPGSSRKIITVGSSDMLDMNKSISGCGPTRECICKPDIVAPGFERRSCAVRKDYRGYVIKSGTSMSTPLVSGSIALLLEKDPYLSNVEVKMILKETAKDLGYRHNQQGWGLLQTRKMLEI